MQLYTLISQRFPLRQHENKLQETRNKIHNLLTSCDFESNKKTRLKDDAEIAMHSTALLQTLAELEDDLLKVT